MTEQITRSCNGSNKRKAEATVLDSCATKRSKKDSKKSRSTREQDRILLENFVKYGILPPSPKSGVTSISTTMQSPISPLRTPKRLSEDQRVPEIDQSPRGVETSVHRRANKFWRPWLEPFQQTTKEYRNKQNTPVANNISRKTHSSLHIRAMSNVNKKVAMPISPIGMLQQSHSCEKTKYKSAESRFTESEKIAKTKRTSSAPTVTTWDTRSPEFLKSFKQPVRLMWPKSQAFDYKYRDAQQLLRSFPVQAAIGFYDDQDVLEDQIVSPNYHSHHYAPKRCTPVLN